jgi:hypothetical protein
MLTESFPKITNKYTCTFCDYSTSHKGSYAKHLSTSKHLRLTESCTNITDNYSCLVCDYHTSKKSSYDKHLTTGNHNELTSVNKKVTKSCSKVTNDFICDFCEKSYISRVGLWKHKKTCSIICNNISENEKHESSISDKELVMILLKENSDFKNMIMKLVEKVENGVICNNNNNNTTNSHNNAFNLNFFLNETCKNAMNITDFVDSLQLQLSDLESIGDIGYVEGISKIIVKSLKALDETERPIHCTDKKRETFYIKDDDKWEKEDDNKTHIRKAIKYVANKNTLLVPQWKAKYPDYNDSSSIQSDKYNNMIIEVLGGDDESEQSENKIIKI